MGDGEGEGENTGGVMLSAGVGSIGLGASVVQGDARSVSFVANDTITLGSAQHMTARVGSNMGGGDAETARLVLDANAGTVKMAGSGIDGTADSVRLMAAGARGVAQGEGGIVITTETSTSSATAASVVMSAGDSTSGAGGDVIIASGGTATGASSGTIRVQAGGADHAGDMELTSGKLTSTSSTLRLATDAADGTTSSDTSAFEMSSRSSIAVTAGEQETVGTVTIGTKSPSAGQQQQQDGEGEGENTGGVMLSAGVGSIGLGASVVQLTLGLYPLLQTIPSHWTVPNT